MKKIIFLAAYIGMFSVALVFGQSGNYGTIEGKLMYPSDYIPPTMIVCVQENKSRGKTICSDSKTKGYKFNLNYEKAVYSAKLPAGEYFVFAAFPYGKAPTNGMEGSEAFYNEFVTCGLNVKCKSRKRISVNVEPNKTVSNITPGDWYVPNDF